MGLSSGDTFTSVSHCVSFRIRGRGKSDFFSWVYIPHIHNKSLSWNVALNKKTIEELILYVTLWSSCPQFVRIVSTTSTTASFSLFIFVQKNRKKLVSFDYYKAPNSKCHFGHRQALFKTWSSLLVGFPGNRQILGESRFLNNFNNCLSIFNEFPGSAVFKKSSFVIKYKPN